MKKKKVAAIFAPSDTEQVRPILEALRARGITESAAEGKKTPGKGEVALLFLSKSFSADEAAQERFFAADSASVPVIPVDLDGSAPPQLVQSALMAKNAIATAGRTPEENAERIASAEVFKDGNKLLPRILIGAAAALAIGALIWLGLARAPETAPEEEGPAAPVMAESDIAAAGKLGLRPEDLAAITSFGIIGDKIDYGTMRMTTDSDIGRSGKGFFLGDVAYEDWDREENTRRWFSAEDGHRFTLTSYEDLSVIERMPNLRSLTLILVDCDKLPELSGLEKLEELKLFDCRLPGLDWVSDARMLSVSCQGCSVEDFSALGSCERLRDAEFEFYGLERADLSRAGGPSLHNVWISGDSSLREIDLSGLADCPLWELRLDELPLRDLDFLVKQDGMSQLELANLRQLEDIKAVRELSSLTWLWLRELPRVNDLSAFGQCSRLKSFNMEGLRQVQDLSFLSRCPSLQNVWIGDVELENLDFIEPMTKSFGVSLGVHGRVRDWSALSKISFYSELSVRPEDGNIGAILPYLTGCSVSNLTIENVRGLDLSALPKVSTRLSLKDCHDLADLSALDGEQSFCELELENLQMLRSLSGLEKVNYFGESDKTFNCMLRIDSCPRLSDWSALRSKKLGNICIRGVYTLPDFSTLRYNSQTTLRLENIPDLTDLSIFDGIVAPESINFSFELVGLDDLSDISALRRFCGERLLVPPELEAQAAALVETKRFGRYELSYPEGGWGNDYDDFMLMSLEELETMPSTILRHVTSVSLAGDQLVDRSRYDVWDNWDGRRHHVVLVDRDSGEQTEVELGGYSDFSALSKLTGLRRLELCAMPLESLEGIQVFEELEELRIQNCPKLTDASAAFTLQNLRCVEIGRCPITSIQGVQNLTELQSLGIYETKVKDLSPLRELDHSASAQERGFDLSLGGTDCGDYSPVEAVPAFVSLDLNGVKYPRWPDLTQIGSIRRLTAHGSDIKQEDLEALTEAHPEIEELQIPYNEKITDLTPLLELPELRRVIISGDMNRAVASLDGMGLPFELEIW